MSIFWIDHEGKTGEAENAYEFQMQSAEQPKEQPQLVENRLLAPPEPFDWQHIPSPKYLDNNSLENSIDENGPALIVPKANLNHPKIQEFLKNPPSDFEIIKREDDTGLIYIRRKPGVPVASRDDVVDENQIKLADMIHDLRVKWMGDPDKWSTKEEVGNFINQAMSVMGGGVRITKGGVIPKAANMNKEIGQIGPSNLDAFMEDAWATLKKDLNDPYKKQVAIQQMRSKLKLVEDGLTTETIPQQQQAQHQGNLIPRTEELKQQILDLHSKGLKREAIAAEVGVNGLTLNRMMKDFDLQDLPPVKKLKTSDFNHVKEAFDDAVAAGKRTKEDIASYMLTEYGVPVATRTVSELKKTAAEGLFKTWTPEKLEQMTKLRSEGLSFGQIADRMGTTRGQVAGKLSRLK